MARAPELPAAASPPARPSATGPVAVFAAIAIGLPAVGALSYRSSAAELRRQRERELETLAAVKVEEIGRWRVERLADAAVFAADPTLHRAVSGAAPPVAWKEVARWFETLRADGEYESISVVGADGNVRFAAGDPTLGEKEPAAGLVREALRRRTPVMSDVHRHDPDDPLHVAVAAPLVSADGSAPEAAVVIRVDPSTCLFPAVQSWPMPGATAELLLARVEGDRVTFANELRDAAPGGEPWSIPLDRREDPSVRATERRRLVTEGTDHRGERVLAAVAPVPDTPWSLVAKVGVDDALAPLQDLARWMAGSVLALVAAAGAAALLWWRAARAAAERARLREEAAREAAAGEERRRSEEALRASEAKFRAAFEFATLGILLVGPDGRLLETNRAARQTLGRGEEELRGLSFADIHSPADRASADAILRQMREGGVRAVELPRRLLRRDGTLAEVILRASALRDDAGAFRFALGVVEDVTEKKRLEAQLVLADRMASVGTLAAGVAHEINNPLAFILANVEFALGELPRGADPEVLRALDEARGGAQRVREIVRDLKAFSRADAEARETVDLRCVLQSALGLAQNEIRHRARLEVDVGDVPPVSASEHRLGQVFLNLLINAAQAIPEGRAAENVVRAVTSTAPDGRAVVEIVDSGCGIAADVLPRIFDPFFTTKPVGVGTGLGLSICHGIVSAMGGEIQVESAPGRGSTFRVLLLPARGPARAAGRRAGEAAPAPRRGRILVVDDEPLVGRAVNRILAADHDVVTRTSAREALEDVARDGGFDVVLCDLMMPNMTGMELHARLRDVAPLLAERTVFLTGGAFTPSAREFLSSVPNARIEKPFDPDALRGLVARVLAEAPPAAPA